MPGVNEVHDLNKLDKVAIDEKVKRLVEYSKNAQAEIRVFAREVFISFN
jgi:hypothetical protein